MIDVHEMIRMKENDILRVRKEIQALHFVAHMLFEPEEAQAEKARVLQLVDDPGAVNASFEGDVVIENRLHEPEDFSREEAGDEAAEVLSHSIPPKRSRLRDLLGLAAGE